MSAVTARRSRIDVGALLVLGAAVCWGTTGTAQAFAPPGATPLSVGAVRLAVGGVALLLFAAGQGLLRLVPRLPLVATLCAAAAVAAYQPFFFAGVQRTGVAVGTVIAIGSAPVIAGLLGIAVRRERPGRRWLVSTALAVAGGALLAFAGGSGAVQTDPLGMALAVGAGASYALYTLFIKQLLDRVPADLAAAAVFFVAALILSPLLFVVDLSWLAEPRGLLVALELGLVATAAAYVLYARGLRLIPVATAVTLALGEPVVASLLGVFVLGEQLTPLALLGIALVFAGLAWLTLARSP